MTSPDPNSPDPRNHLGTLIEAFTKLPPLLSYGGLIFSTAIIILSLTGTLPEVMLWFPAVAIVAFLVYAYMQLAEEKAKRQHELAKQAQEFQHQQEMARLNTPQPPPTPNPTPAPTPTPTPAIEWERRYLEHLLHLCGYPPAMALIDLKEVGLSGQKLGLERIFTSLDVPARVAGQQSSALWSQEDDQARDIEEQNREPALTALSQPQNQRLVLLGAPGSGKSTLVNYLTLCLAGDHLGSERVNQGHLQPHGWQLTQQRLWPVRVILREYAARGLSQQQGLWQFLAADLQRETVQLADYVPTLKTRLEQEGGLLLLDGLDEVDKAPAVRDPLKRNIELFARDFPRVRIVVTSRPYAYGSGWELPQFQVTRLLPFNEKQINAFITQWYSVMGQQDGTLGPDKAQNYAAGLVRQVKQNRNLGELARHPLLLTMMVYIHRGREGGALPQRREELYRLCVVLLLDLWRRSKSIPGQQTQTLAEVLGIDSDRLLAALAEVAFVAHSQQPDQAQTADVPGELLAGKLHKHKGQDSRVSINDLIEYVRDRAGLLETHGRTADDRDDVYRFPHRTFQEYLAGLHLLKDNFPYQLASLARQDPTRWRESLLLAAASQREVPFTVWSLVDTLCYTFPPLASDSLNQLLTPAHTPNQTSQDFQDLWGAFLAGQALTETDLTAPEKAQSAREKQTRNCVQQWQRSIVVHGLLPPPDRALAGESLAALGDDRPGIRRNDEMRFCLVPAGRFWLGDDRPESKGHWNDTLNLPYWIGQYPVTVAQFREFVQACPYAPSWAQSLDGPDNWPVAYLHWYDALALAAWLQQRWHERGWLPAGYRVSLPSTAEWEKAARGGDTIPIRSVTVSPAELSGSLTHLPPMQPNSPAGEDLRQRAYPWGNEPEQERLSATATLHRANNEAAGIGGRCVVGSFPAGASPYGCLDMSGQVWEWTRSYFEKNYPYRPEATYDTIDRQNQAPMTLRGGSFYHNQNGCSSRVRDFPHLNFNGNHGVRLVVSPFLTAVR